MHTMRLRFQKGDLIAIAGVLVLAVLVLMLFLPKQEAAAYAEIYQDGKRVKTVLLTEDQEFTVTGTYSNTITVLNGRIAVTESDCPGGDCLRCGWLDSTGRSIVCLPNGLEIRVVAERNDVDFAVG